MADLIDFGGEASPTPAAPPAGKNSEENLLSSFDPLSSGGGAPTAASSTSTTSTSPGSTGGAALGMPKEIAAAFADNNGMGSQQQAANSQEVLPSGLTVEGQAALMKQIQESAKEMAKEGGEAHAAVPALDSVAPQAAA